jgi:hypothetical protein
MSVVTNGSIGGHEVTDRGHETKLGRPNTHHPIFKQAVSELFAKGSIRDEI